VWEQQFTYDAFGNLTKSVPTGATGITWQPGYSSSTNRYTLGGTSYDANGNVLKDTFNTYTWDAEGKNLSTAYDNGGGQTLSFTYDAFGRMVEASVNSTWRTYWYTQAGELVMEGTTILTGRWPTSSGTVETIGTSCCEYLHNDWLGNARIVSSTSNNTVSADQAYTPYGEIYNMFGANNGQYQVFAGTIADLAPGTTTPIMWDTPNRELSYAGRWLSPDPAGSGWNQYAYAGNNPLSYRDPLGLDYCADSGGNVIADEEGGGNDFSCGNAGGNWVQAPDPTFIANSNADVSQAPTFQDDLDFLQLWASGVGPSAINYGPNDGMTQQLAKTATFNKIREKYIQEGCPSTSPSTGGAIGTDHVGPWLEGFGPPGNAALIQVGGFVAYGQTNGDATTFTAVNVAGMASFTGETTWAPIINGATGSNIDPNSLNNPNGPDGQFHNITQTFTWTENNLCTQGG
jgi:RHS repeat-associated protein